MKRKLNVVYRGSVTTSPTADMEIVRTVDVELRAEVFPPPLASVKDLPDSPFKRLFDKHAMEVAGRPFKLDYQRYYNIEIEERLVWIAAYDLDDQSPIGYSGHIIYSDLHFCELMAVDDLWFVLPEFRNRGIGLSLKQMGHRILKERGCVRVWDNIRDEFDHPNLMANIGFRRKAIRWVKDL